MVHALHGRRGIYNGALGCTSVRYPVLLQSYLSALSSASVPLSTPLAITMSDHLPQQPPHRFETYESFIAWLTVTEAEKTGDVTPTTKMTSFLCFRKWFREFVFPGLLQELLQGSVVAGWKGPQQRHFSKLAGLAWGALPQNHRDFWTQVSEHVKMYRGRRYPSFDPAESQPKRKGKKSQRKARGPENAEPCGAGPQRSSNAAVRSEPYPTQRGRSLPSSTIHTSTSLPTAGPSTSVGAYTTHVAVCPPAFHPTMHGPSPSSSVAPSSSFAFPPSFYSSSTLPSSAPLPPSSFFAPPPSWMPSQQYPLPSSASALPFPLTSHVPATALAAGPAAFPPPQTQYQAPHGDYPSIAYPPASAPEPLRVGFVFEIFGEIQADATREVHLLPEDDLFATYQPTSETPTAYGDADGSDFLFHPSDPSPEVPQVPVQSDFAAVAVGSLVDQVAEGSLADGGRVNMVDFDLWRTILQQPFEPSSFNDDLF
ncbi:hypothetical protein LXA43DRAFT_636680 [Ganoderma leucocontextum]|nr:hypothetical protein LXA43DRAFT_636680 [Ganoderma leucocontextum]